MLLVWLWLRLAEQHLSLVNLSLARFVIAVVSQTERATSSIPHIWKQIEYMYYSCAAVFGS